MRDRSRSVASLKEDFIINSAFLYIAAFQYDLQHKVPDWMIGKKLGHIALRIEHTPQIEEEVTKNTITKEIFIAKAALLGFEQDIEAEQTVTNKDDIVAIIEAKFKDQLVMQFGEMPLTDSLDITKIPADLIESSYYAVLASGHTVYCGDNNNPSRKTLTRANTYTRNLLNDYVRTDYFDKDINKRLFDSLITGDPGTSYSHMWDIPYVADLYISGKESVEYIKGYIKNLENKIENKRNIIQRYKEAKIPQIIINEQEEQIDMLEIKIRHVKTILAGRKS